MNEDQSLFELEVDHGIAEELLDTSRWQRMFGILMFSVIGLITLALLVGWSKIAVLIDEAIAGEGSQAAMAVVVVAVFLVAVVIGIMSWLLIRSSGRIKTAIRLKDQALFNEGLSDLKTFFIVYGVISILGLLGNLVSFL
jgi:hypothetical protein